MSEARDDDDELDDASLRSMRAVWLSMRDEEPPTAGMSALLAAAAVKADAMREKPAWWERVLAMLRKPPTLAFATVMILIGGAVLVTRTSEDKQVESMTAATPEPPAVEHAPATVTSSAEPQQEAQPAPAVEPTPTPLPPPPPPPNPKDVTRGAKVKPPAQTYKEEVKALEEPAKAEPVAGKEAAGGGFESPGRDQGVRAPVQSRPEPAPETGDDVLLSDRSAPATPPNEQLLRQAESAASRGDCAAVKTIAARIQRQDDAFYKQRVLKHAALAKCL